MGIIPWECRVRYGSTLFKSEHIQIDKNIFILWKFLGIWFLEFEFHIWKAYDTIREE